MMKRTGVDLKTHLKICLAAGAAAAGWVLTVRSEVKNQVWLGLSRNQMVLLAGIGLGIVAVAALLGLVSRSQNTQARLEQALSGVWPSRLAAWGALLVLMAISGGLLAAVPAYRALTLRVLPLPAWMLFAAGQVLVYRAARGLPLVSSGTLRRFGVSALLLLWPFLFLWPYVLPVGQKFLSIGNDFIPFYYVYKPILLSGLTHLRVPLWSPGEAAGFPFAVNPFSQAFYPLNLPLAIFDRLAGGFSVLDYQRYTVLALSIFCLGLYGWLRSLSIRRGAALAAALVMSVSFKMTELLRWPNALHSAAWFPWLLLAMTVILTSRSWKTRLLASAGLGAAWICLFTAGYPYFLYYSLFLLGPYLAAWLIPGLRRRVFPRHDIQIVPGLVTAAGFSALALAVCLPYLLQVNALLNQTTHRAGGDFAFATANQFSLLGTLGSLFFPPAANTEGTYFFGSAAVLVTLAFLVLPSRRWLGARSFFAAWIFGVSWITYGSASALFLLLWKLLPFFSRLREWGRLNVILVPVLAWVFARALQEWFFPSESDSTTARPSSLRLTIAALGLAGFAFQVYILTTHQSDPYWTDHFLSRMAALLDASGLTGLNLASLYETWLIAFGAAAVGCLLLLLRPNARIRAGWAAALIAGLAVMNIAPAGPYLWAGAVSAIEPRREINLPQLARASLEVPRSDHYELSNSARFHTGYAGTNWYLDAYTSFRDQAAEDEPAVQELLGISSARRLFFSAQIEHPNVRAFLEDANRFPIHPDIVEYNGDRLILDLEAPAAGYLSFIDNAYPGWIARVDGAPVSIERLFGTFKSISLQPGRHQVEFRFQPGFLPFGRP